MVLHLRIEQDGPTAGGAHAEEARVGRWIELVQRDGIAQGEQGVGRARAFPDFVGPWGEGGGEGGREIEAAGWQASGEAERFHAEPSSAGEGCGVERGAAQRSCTDGADVAQE